MVVATVGCGERRAVDVTPHARQRVLIDDTETATKLLDFSYTLSPEFVGAEEYLFSMSWRETTESANDMTVWKVAGETIGLELWLPHPDTGKVSASTPFSLKKGKLYEFDVRRGNDGIWDALEKQSYEELRRVRDNSELVRSIKVHLE